MSLRNRISALVVAVLLPPAALMIYSMVETRERERRDIHTEAFHQAQLVADRFETIVQGAGRLSWALSQHPAIRSLDPAGCTALLRQLLAESTFYRNAFVAAPDGTIRCATAEVPPGTSVADRAYFQRAIAEPRLVITEMVDRSRISGLPMLPLARRFSNGDGVAGAIVLVLDLDRLAREFQRPSLRANSYVSVLDAGGKIVVRWPGHQDAIGRKISPAGLQRMSAARSGTFEWRDTFDRPAIIGFVKIEGFTISVGIDPDVVLAQLNAATWRNAVLLALALLLAAGGAWWAGNRLVRQPIKRMVLAARRREGGERTARFPAMPPRTELGELSSALNQMADANDRLVGEREFLMRELQHRVMNSLQLLVSMLHLQSRNTEPAVREALTLARQRVLSMAVIFRYLYRADLSATIEFGDFLKSFCHDTSRAYLGADAESIVVAADRCEMPLEQALSLALVTHELVTNAVKHAFAPGAAGRIEVSFTTRADGMAALSVSDNGKGLPEGATLSETRSLGMTLIDRLTKSVNGRLEVKSGSGGTNFTIVFTPQT